MHTGIGALTLAGAIAAFTSPAAVGKTLAAQQVSGTVQSVSGNTLVISHITSGRAVSASTLAYNIQGTTIIAPNTWVLENDFVLLGTLNNPFWHHQLLQSPGATNLLGKLGNPAKNANVWVAKWGSVGTSYLAPGDVVNGVSALSQARVARSELTGLPVPLATIQDMATHTPAPPPTVAQKLEAKLAAIDLANLTK
jgi:hypothetical protein